MITLPTMRVQPIALPMYDPIHGSVFRIISSPFCFYVHIISTRYEFTRNGVFDGSEGSKMFIKCHPPRECKICKNLATDKNRPSFKRYVLVVIDCVDGGQKYLEISVAEYEGLQDAINSRGNWDIDFTVCVNPLRRNFSFIPEDTCTGPQLLADNLLYSYYQALMTSEQYDALQTVDEIIV